MKGNGLKPIKKMPIGGLDSDTSLQLVEPQDYIAAKNLQNINKEDSNEDIDIQALKGNIVGFKIDDLTAQAKVVSILLKDTDLPTNPDFTAGDITTINFYTQNDYLITSVTLDTTMADAAAYAAAIQAALIAAGFTLAQATVVSLSGNPYVYAINIYIDSASTTEDFTLTSVAAAPNNVVFDYTTKQEAINQLLAGRVECIGSDTIQQDLFLYGTTVTTKDLGGFTIVVVTNVVDAATRSIVNVQTLTAHNLTTGDSVIITNNGGLADGIWQVFVVNSTNFYLYNSQFAVFSAGVGGNVAKYIEGYGGIYYANRDRYQNWLDSYTSTSAKAIKLLGAKGLNFITTHQIDSVVKKNNYQTKFKLTDYYNKPKMLLYKESDYIENGFIYYPDYADLAIYNYDNIASQSNLIQGVENIKIDVSEVIGGGQVTTRNYAFCVRLSNDDNSASAWSFQSPVISIIKQDTTDVSALNTLAFGGDVSAEPTNKGIALAITGIPPSTYKYIEIAVLPYEKGFLGGVLKLNKLPLPLSADSFDFIYTGPLPDSEVITINDITNSQVSIDKALNICELDNRIILSNVSFLIDPDLTAVSSAITVSVKRKAIQKKGTLSATTPLLFGEYEIIENIINYTGYHLMDKVPLGITYKIKNGGWTRSYAVDTVEILTGLISSGLDYSMTSATESYTYYFELTNIDWDYLVNGVRLRDLIEDAMITRADINSEVIASGIFTVSDKPLLSTSHKPQYTGAAIGGTSNRNIGFFYSPDFNNLSAQPYVWQSGDRIINLGSAVMENSYVAVAGLGSVDEFNGELSANYQDLSIDSVINFFPNSIGPTTFPSFPDIAYLVDANLTNTWNSCYALYVDNGGGGMSNLTANTDLGIYNAIIIRPQTQLYPTDVSLLNYKPIQGVNINVSTDTASTTYDVFGGDTFTVKKYIKTRNTLAAVDAVAFGYYSQSKQNTQLSKGTFPLSDLVTPPTLVSPAVNNYLQHVVEFVVENYDTSFNILNFIDNIVGYSSSVADESSSLATVYWSQQAFEDSQQNNDRIFLPFDNKALDLTYGAIMHMVVANDILYTLQPNRTVRQYFNNTNQLTTVNNTEVLLGTGNVMGTKGEFKSGYGTVHKFSCIKYKTDGGRDAFVYIDAIRKKFVRNGDDGTVVISDRWNLANWSLKNLKYTWNHTTPADNYGIHGVYDNKNKTIIITSRCYRKEDFVWELAGRYRTGQFVTNNYFYGFDGQPILFICKSNNIGSSLNEPYVGANWTTFWEQVPIDSDYYNWWSIVISERENKFKWLQTPKPKIWFPYQETILSPNPIKPLTTGYNPPYNQIFEFTETNEQCAWYCYILGNGVMGTVVDNTISFYTGVPPFTTPYSLYDIFPNISVWGDMEVSIFDGANYYIITDLNTAGTVATLNGEPNDEREYQIRVCNVEDAYITNVVNENNGIKVKFVATQYNSFVAPERVDVNTNNLQSFIANSDFTAQEEYYSAPIGFDTTNNPTDNMADTSMIFGKYLVVKTTLKRRILQKINNFVVIIRELNRKI